MDVYTDRSVSRLEIVEAGGRRRFSDAAKLRIVAESYSGRRLGSATARKYGITRSQLADWRNAARIGRLGAVSPEGFVPVVAEVSSPVAGPPISSGAGRMEIVSLNGRRVIVDIGVDVAVLLCVVRGLETL
ncbi:MAG: transposase [Nitrobacter sp.]